MKEYIIITDSTTDLPYKYAEGNNLMVLPLGFIVDGKNFRNYLDNRELSSNDFYDMIKAGKSVKTYQINPEEFYYAFKKVLINGYGILGIFFSSGLSGTYNSAGGTHRSEEDAGCACGSPLHQQYASENRKRNQRYTGDDGGEISHP